MRTSCGTSLIFAMLLSMATTVAAKDLSSATPSVESTIIKGIAQWQADAVEKAALDSFGPELLDNHLTKQFFPQTTSAIRVNVRVEGRQLIPTVRYFFEKDVAVLKEMAKCFRGLDSLLADSGGTQREDAIDKLEKAITNLRKIASSTPYTPQHFLDDTALCKEFDRQKQEATVAQQAARDAEAAAEKEFKETAEKLLNASKTAAEKEKNVAAIMAAARKAAEQDKLVSPAPTDAKPLAPETLKQALTKALADSEVAVAKQPLEEAQQTVDTAAEGAKEAESNLKLSSGQTVVAETAVKEAQEKLTATEASDPDRVNKERELSEAKMHLEEAQKAAATAASRVGEAKALRKNAEANLQKVTALLNSPASKRAALPSGTSVDTYLAFSSLIALANDLKETGEADQYVIYVHQLLNVLDAINVQEGRRGQFAQFQSSAMFLAGLLDAGKESPEAVEAVLTLYVDREAAYASKRTPSGDVVLWKDGWTVCNSILLCPNTLFIGSYFGLSGVAVDEDGVGRNEIAARAYGPIGIETKLLLLGQYPLTLGYAPIDVGGYVMAELKGDEYDADFSSIASPSVYLSVSHPRRSLALLAGYQWGIQLKNDREQGSAFVAVAFDLPLLKLY